MAAQTIDPGDLVVKDPSAIKVYQFDWTSYLTDLGVETIAQSSFTITGPDSVLTKDNESVIVGNLKTQLRLSAGTLGATYIVANKIVTNASPANTDERSFFVLVEDR
jgi:hypothetical protein